MKVSEALNALAVEGRAKARYFEARAGRLPESKIVPLQAVRDRADAERKALAFRAAAERIDQLVEEETNV